MGFDDEVGHYRSSKDSEERSEAEQRAARLSVAVEEYESEIREALDHLSRHLHPTRLLLAQRIIRANIYTPDGYIPYSRPEYGVASTPSTNIYVEMLTTDGQVWIGSMKGVLSWRDLSAEDVLSRGYVFGLKLSIDRSGHLTVIPDGYESGSPEPFREHLVSLCAAAHATHAART